jgi:hypothetical protein
MRNLLIAYIALLLIAAACSKGGNSSSDTTQIAFRECIRHGNAVSGIDVCFDSLSDSRCPKGVVCIWQGMAVAKFSYRRGNQSGHFRLSNLLYNPMGVPNDTIVAGYRIQLVNVFPYPDISIKPDNRIRKAELKITKE